MKKHRPGARGHEGHLPSSGRALAISAWLTGIYFIIELVIGLWTGSIAVISDAFHTFSAVGGVLVAIVAARIARRPASDSKTFGWYRAEIVGALINGAFLLIMAIVVIVMGLMRLSNPVELPTGPMLLAAAGGLVTEFISLWLLYKQQGNDLNVKGAYWHIIQTFVGSLIIIIAALTIQLTGFLAIDPLLGTAFGIVLLWASYGILKEAVHLLMEGTPPDVSLVEVKSELENLEGVSSLHHIHAWALTSGRYVFSAHAVVDIDVGQTNALLETLDQRLRDDFGFYFTTLQIERGSISHEGASDIDAVDP